jgi:hypothetical protein
MKVLTEKQLKVGSRTARASRIEKSALKNAIEIIDSVTILLAYIYPIIVALLPHTRGKIASSSYLNQMPCLIAFISFHN